MPIRWDAKLGADASCVRSAVKARTGCNQFSRLDAIVGSVIETHDELGVIIGYLTWLSTMMVAFPRWFTLTREGAQVSKPLQNCHIMEDIYNQ